MSRVDDDKRDDEETLRVRFAELKKLDARTAPDFGKMTSAPRPLRSPWRIIVPIASLAAAAMLVLWCGAQTMMLSSSSPSSSSEPTPRAPMGGEARATVAVRVDPMPLDFLLDTSGVLGGAATMTTTNVGTNANPIKGW